MFYCVLIQWKLQNTLILAYSEALNEGAVPAAYVRLMFLGAGGSGKSSLLDGLMNIPLRQAESTALADTRTVSYKWITADSTGEAWKPRTDDDEKRNLAAKAHQLHERGYLMSVKILLLLQKEHFAYLKIQFHLYNLMNIRLIQML